MSNDTHELDPKIEPPFRSFIENLPVMFYAVTPRPPHRPLYISPSFACFGYPIEEIGRAHV